MRRKLILTFFTVLKKINCIFKIIKAPPLKPFLFSEIQKELEKEYENYINH